MSSYIRPLALVSILGSSASFQKQSLVHPPRPSNTKLFGASYLENLNGGVATSQGGPGIPSYLDGCSTGVVTSSEGGVGIPSYLDAISSPATSKSNTAPPAPYTVVAAPAPAPSTKNNIASISSEIAHQPDVPTSFTAFPYAPLEYFAIPKLVSKGPRETADWGSPEDASRPLANDGMLRAGSWWCSEGGWPSPNPKAHTEIFYVYSGHGCLGDADGKKHYFGPGDTVIIPKGHIGRWDVNSPVHKIWAVNAHEKIAEKGPIVRVRVVGYHSFAPQYLFQNGGYDFLYYSPHPDIASNTFYNCGPTKAGVWTCPPSSFSVEGGPRAFFHLLEGVVVVTDAATGEARRCVAGDTMMLPAGWSGYVDVIETCKKLWTTAD